MKKHVIAVVMAVALTALVPLGLEAGVVLKGGLSRSSLAIAPTPPPPSFGNLQYYTGGLSLSLGLGIVSLRPEVLYVRMGGAYETDEANSREIRHDYVQVPILLRFNVVPLGPVRPFICGGGYGSYLIKSVSVLETGGVVEKEDLTDEYLRYDYGVVVGAGIAFKVPLIGFSIEGRYNYGLANIIKDPAAGESLKNRSLMVLVGIGF
jgi:hypothetical protein